MNDQKIKVSIMLEREHWERIQKAFNQIPIRRDVLINNWLASVLDDVSQMPKNTLSKDEYKMFANDLILIEKVKVNIALDRQLVEKLDVILAEKRVPRGLFFTRFILAVEVWIYELSDLIHDPLNWAFEKNPCYRDIFPSPTQADLVKSKYRDFLASLRDVNPDDFLPRRNDL